DRDAVVELIGNGDHSRPLGRACARAADYEPAGAAGWAAGRAAKTPGRAPLDGGLSVVDEDAGERIGLKRDVRDGPHVAGHRAILEAGPGEDVARPAPSGDRNRVSWEVVPRHLLLAGRVIGGAAVNRGRGGVNPRASDCIGAERGTADGGDQWVGGGPDYGRKGNHRRVLDRLLHDIGRAVVTRRSKHR